MSAIRMPVMDELADILEFWSPSEVKNYIASVGQGYTALATDLGNNPQAFNEAEIADWAKTLSNFIDFAKGVGFFSSLSMSPVRTAEMYAGKLAYYRELFKNKAGKAPTGANITIPSQNQDKAVDTIRLVAISAGVLAGAFIVRELLSTARGLR